MDNEQQWEPVAGWEWMRLRQPWGTYYVRRPAKNYKPEALKTKDLAVAKERYIALCGKPIEEKAKVSHAKAWELFFEHTFKVGDENTGSKQLSCYRRHIEPHVHGAFEKFNRDFVNAVLDSAEERVSDLTGEKLSVSMLRSIKSTMGSFGNYCRREGWLVEKPTDNLQLRYWMSGGQKSGKSKSVVVVRPVSADELVSDDELEAIVSNLGDYTKRAVAGRRVMAQLQVLTGLRISEVLALHKADLLVDEETYGRWGSLRVDKQIRPRFKTTDTTTYLKDVKSDAGSRLVPLFEESRVLLDTYIELAETEGWLLEGELLFQANYEKVGGRNVPLRAGNVSLEFSVAAAKAGIERRITSHYFRHTFASRLFANGVDLGRVARVMGNTEKVCRDTYVHFIKQGAEADQIAELMARR